MTNKGICIYSLLFFIIPSVTYGEALGTEKKLNLQTSLSTQSLQFMGKGENKFQYYNPNENLSLGIKAQYKNYGFSFHVGLTPLNAIETNGKTSVYDGSLFWYQDQWGIDIYLQVYTGLYWEDEPQGCEKGLTCSLLPNSTLSRFGGTWHYSFDENFSFQSAFHQTNNNIHRATSWLGTLSVNGGYADIENHWDVDNEPNMAITPLENIGGFQRCFRLEWG
jgi:hypothetical protein